MTKPTTYTEIAFTTTPADTAPAWEDVTPYVMNSAGGINIVKWRPDEFAQCQPSTCNFTLNNESGDFTPGLATGAHYPYVKKGRRVRVVSTTFANTAFDVDTTGWSGSNATLAQVATPVRSGAGAMRLTATASADMSADTPSGLSGEPVVAGAAYALMGWFRTAVTARSCKMRADWYDAAGAFISSSDTATITDSTSAYTAAEARVVAPASAAFVRVRAMIAAPAASEVHYVDFALVGSVRFSGYIDDWQVTWPGTVASFATCAVTASSRMARLGAAGELGALAIEELELQSPDVLWPLTEPEGLTEGRALDPQDPPLSRFRGVSGTDATPLPTFAGGVQNPTDALPMVAMPTQAAGAPSGVLRSYGGASDATYQDWSSVMLFSAPLAGGVFFAQLLRSFEAAQYLAVELQEAALRIWNSGVVEATDASVALLDAGFHTLGLSVNPDSGTGDAEVSAYVDGALIAGGVITGVTYPTAILTDFQIGQYDSGADDGTFVSVGRVGFWRGTLLTADQHASLASALLDGFAGETPAARLDRYAVLAGVPAVETDFDIGDVTGLAHIDTTSKTALACMRDVETTEGGVLFDASDGTLKFHDRSRRYGATSAFTVALSDGVVTTPFAPILDDQQMVNDMTGTGSTGITGRYSNTASIDEYGSYRKTIDVATSNADEPLMAAGWRVNRYSDPVVRMGPVDVHLNKATEALTAAVLAAEVATKFTLTGLPANAPESSMVLFVEGEQEHIDASEHKVTLLTSAADVFDVWILDSSTQSQLDQTTKVAY